MRDVDSKGGSLYGGGRHNGNLCTFLSFLRGSKTALKGLTNRALLTMSQALLHPFTEACFQGPLSSLLCHTLLNSSFLCKLIHTVGSSLQILKPEAHFTD